MTRLTTLEDGEDACACVAREMADAITRAIAERGQAHVALAGGNTPRRAYELLAPLIEDWSAVSLWYGDERCVGPDDPDSNHRMVAESLLAAIGGSGGELPLEQRVRGELGPEDAAREYAGLLEDRLPTDADASHGGESAMPRLDIALLGLGEDGHTASLFPGHAELDAHGELCLAVHDAPKPPPERVTLSVELLRAARACILLATGAGKAQPLAAVLRGPDREYPASLLGSDRLHVICDSAAAAQASTS